MQTFANILMWAGLAGLGLCALGWVAIFALCRRCEVSFKEVLFGSFEDMSEQ